MRVNNHFATELHKVLRPDDIVWVHDYHLLPLARMLRERGHRNRMGFFLHVPFPPPEILIALPNHDRLIPSMTHYDVIGFQTENDTDNFARYLANECHIPMIDSHTFHSFGHPVRVGTFPISIPAGAARDAFAIRKKRAGKPDRSHHDHWSGSARLH